MNGSKSNTFTNQDFQNSELLIRGTYTYPSGYIVTDPDGYYSKHYYNGSQRIASRIGDGTCTQFEKPSDKISDLQARQKEGIMQNAKVSGITKVDYEAYSPASIDELESDSLKAAGVVSIYYYHTDHLGTNTLITDMSGNPSQFFLNLPFGETMVDQRATTLAYNSPYKFNGKELDEGTGMYYYGARYYDPRISVWMSVDPMAEKGTYISPYAYCFNQPINYNDPLGQWPGVTTIFFRANIGAAIGYGVYAVQQTGIARDDYGKTHFTMTGTAYIVNQNLQEGSTNPNFILGVEAGVSVGVSQDWSSNSFIESIGMSNQFSVPGPTVKGSFGISLAGNKNSVSVGIGPQFGATFNTMGMAVDESISLTNAEASQVNSKTDVFANSWTVGDVKPTVNLKGNLTGYSGSVLTKNTKGNFINTGIKVNCGINYKNGKATPGAIWVSPAYQKKLDDDK